MKTLGVLGGAGPMATAYFMKQIIDMTDAATDQEHIRILVDNNPAIPDRTSFIMDHDKENPEPVFLEMGKGLVASGAEVLAIPCITASYFIPKLEQELQVPVVDALGKTTEYLVKKGIECVGLMATDGTIATGLFQGLLESEGIRVVLPDDEHQKLVMDAIYQQVKAGRPVNVKNLHKVRDYLQQQGAELAILGCTELSVAAMDEPDQLGIENRFLDAMKILAASSILACEAGLKEEL